MNKFEVLPLAVKMKATLVCIITLTLCIFNSYSQAVGDYRSIATGNWNAIATWQTFNGVSWVAAVATPTSTDGVITIQAAHNVTQNIAGLSVDQLVIDGTLTTGTTQGFTIANGAGVDMTINGFFFDVLTSGVITFAGTWQFGPTGTLRKTSGSASNSWQLAYNGGASTMPATANWIIRKTGAANPVLSTTPLGAPVGAYYPNLTIENNTAGTWVTPAASSFPATATTAYPVIKGNLDIGGSGTSTVDFQNAHLYTGGNSTLVQGNVIVRAGNFLRNLGNGLEIQGNLTVNGTISYAGGAGTRNLIFSGANAQTLQIGGAGVLGIRNLQMNKSANTLTLNSPITIDNIGTFTSGIMISSAVNLPTFNTVATTVGASNSSFVSGPVRLLNPAAFTFPVGKVASYRPIGVSASGAVGGTFWTETFDNGCTNACTANGVNTGNGAWTIDNSNNPAFDNCGAVPQHNVWYVSCKENGNASGSCGSGCGSNATLHIGSTTAGDQGGSFDAGGYCDLLGGGFGGGTNTNTMIVSPTISTLGQTNITFSFKYIHFGEAGSDWAWVDYSTNNGVSWNTLANPLPQTTCCGGPCDNFHQGLWATYSTVLPVSAENIAGFKIRFGWINDDDAAGNDPSIAINDITLSTPSTPFDFTAEYFPSNPQIPYGNILVPTLTALSDCEYWILNRNSGTANKQVTLSWNAATCYNTAFASFEVARWDNISGIWQDHDGIIAGTAAGGTVTTPAVVTSFSPFAIAYVPLPLPVEMESVTIDCEDGTGVLKWQTASEINNDYFAIERSSDANTWEEIGRVPGNGNSNIQHSYHWTDMDPLSDGYYRIKQVDFDGLFKIYDPVSLHCISKNNWIKVYPNPSSGTVNIEISQGTHLEAVMIYNSLGQFTTNATINGILGKATVPVDISFLEPGTYYLRLLANGEWLTRPVVIIK